MKLNLHLGLSVVANVILIALIIHSLIQTNGGDSREETPSNEGARRIGVFATPELPLDQNQDLASVVENDSEEEKETMAMPPEMVGIIFSNQMLSEGGVLNSRLVEALEISDQAEMEINRAIAEANRKVGENQDRRIILDPEKVDLPGKQLILPPDAEADGVVIDELASEIVRILDPIRAAALISVMEKEKSLQVEEQTRYIVWQPHPYGPEFGQDDLWQYKVYTLDEEGREGYVDRDLSPSGRYKHHFDE